eukprot:CCRYP_015322-RA/>CCRYP_015322-RA protein AED:0.07 eAED:0.07 QI:0/-1/0/1/-1/1/1/0/437
MVVIKPPTRVHRGAAISNRILVNISVCRCLLLAIVAACLLAAQRFRQEGGLRGSATPVSAPKAEEAAEVKEVVPAVTKAAPAKPAPPDPPASAPQPQFGKLCQRSLGIDLADHTKWGTAHSPSYFDGEPTDSESAVLVVRDSPFGQTFLLPLFHAIDLAYDKQCPVYVAKDAAYLRDMVRTWFYGERDVPDDAFWKDMEDVWNVKLVNTVAEVEASGKKQIHKIGTQAGFYARSKTLDAARMRNRRDTIFRYLFRHSRTEGDGNVCSTIVSLGLDKPGAKYTVIDVPIPNDWNQRFNQVSGRDHNEAFQMKPEYVKSILSPLQMMSHPIFLQRDSLGNNADTNRVEVKRLMEDGELKTQDKDVTINDLHMAVLADVFIGSPASHWSLMVARMRYALGIKNTFVLTKWDPQKKVWVSSVDDINYLELYDPKTMGLWLG